MRWRAGLLVFSLSAVASSAGAEGEKAASKQTLEKPRYGSGAERRVANASFGASPEELLAIQGGCSVVCAQHEACIQQRCVETCSPSCRAGTYCTASGECEVLSHDQKTVLTEADRQRLSGAMSKDKTNAIFVDFGGIVGFGVRPGIEWGEKHAVLARLHLLNTGVMSYAAFAENEFQRFDWGFGLGTGYRHYEALGGNMRGIYYGAGLQFSVLRVGSRGVEDVNETLYSLSPYGEFGYRWVFGDFLLGLGPQLALSYPVASGISGRDANICEQTERCDDANKRRLVGTVNFEVGWFQ